ncbi:MAG TPA: copper amine oxidase N-terminal domain-containing protein [Candidatus Acidoferrum sp.]|nr:copper amine oxidase N-terminal domain-containing protein [Candidatus Acidoferrum sp.]
MALSRTRQLSSLAATALLASTLVLPADAAGPVTVQVNGSTVTLNPAPQERAGRVFVPLRGVFEQLGASVVYASRTINATGRGHSVSLHVGSQQAVVDGQTQTLDVAPFIIGASTYVPLRFVSQALGADVNYDGSNRIVAINVNGGGSRGEQQNAPQPPVNSSPVTIGNLLPGRDATIRGSRPTIQATFEGGTVDANSVRVDFDGRDVTNQTYISTRGITYTPPSQIPAERHTVRIVGNDGAGAQFTRSWSFTSGGSTAVSNQITNVRPGPGATVSNAFEVSGRTTPGATVTVQVGVASSNATNIGQLIGAVFGTGGNSTVQNSVVADQNGRFSSAVQIGAPSGTVLAVVVTSTDPNYGVAATPVRFNVRVQ